MEMWNYNAVLLGLIILIGVGVLNAYNFMDGINGITVGYSLVTVVSLLYVNIYIQSFVPNQFLIIILASLLVFSFYNFRNKAVCFAGDVGSLSIAFIIVFLLIKLVKETNQLVYILFLTLYGIDTIFTLIQRLALRQNIFEAHRMHLFQVGINSTGGSHLLMSLIYALVQVLINIIVIATIHLSILDQMLYLGSLLAVLSLIYIKLKRRIMPEAT
jgi:UDP-N-acetylmuramyl pentapeptide phosphotransferase/UDP-N-acetylglucosamine-1-phosphate transferase